jgi:general secretion pathway protein A
MQLRAKDRGCAGGFDAMDEKRFGLKRRPFPTTPDTTFYYPATVHENVLTSLARGVADDEGIMLLVGPPGTGKTLVGYALLERLPANTVSAFLTNSHYPDRVSLLQAILFDLGLPYDADREQTLRLRLTDGLLKNCGEGRRTVLIIDEAQHLSPDLLEELRLLGNLEANGGKAVQVVLVAQPTLLDTLHHPDLAPLLQRLAIRTQLDALDVEEAYDYLLHHLKLAGGRPDAIFEEGALETLARGTHGIPRLLNQAGQQALLLAESGELSRVDAEAAVEALAQLGLADESDNDDVAGSIGSTIEVGEPAAKKPKKRTA